DFAPATTYTVTVPAGTVVGYDSDITWSFTTATEVIMPQNGKGYNIKYADGRFLTAGMLAGLGLAAEDEENPETQVFSFSDAGDGNWNIATSEGFLYRGGQAWDAFFKENLEGMDNEKLVIAKNGVQYISIRSLLNATLYLGPQGNNVYFDKSKESSQW